MSMHTIFDKGVYVWHANLASCNLNYLEYTVLIIHKLLSNYIKNREDHSLIRTSINLLKGWVACPH